MTLHITLSRRIIRIEPPQHLLLLEITRQLDGFSFKVAPASAVETSGFSLISRSAVSALPREASQLETIATAVAARFPLISEIDISSIPEAYKIMPASVASLIMFSPGDQYAVTVVSDAVHELDVVAS
jgi:hypothetical protein